MTFWRILNKRDLLAENIIELNKRAWGKNLDEKFNVSSLVELMSEYEKHRCLLLEEVKEDIVNNDSQEKQFSQLRLLSLRMLDVLSEKRPSLEKENINTDGIISEKNRITTEKKRIISEKYFSRNYNKHHIRIDDEIVEDIKNKKTFISLIKSQMKEIDAIILQDYNKGNLTKEVIEEVISYANKKNIPTLCDPKIKNFYSFKNCTLIKPNLSEIRNGGGIKINPDSNDEVIFATKKLQERLNCDIVMLTMSENGMQIKTENSSSHYKNVDRKIVDVSGAGDTVISVAALCLSQNTSTEILGFLSNLAGGIVCEYSGVVKLDKEKLYKEAVLHYNKS